MAKTTNDLRWDENRLRSATEAAGVGLWSWNVDTDEIRLDDRSHDLWGVPNTGEMTFERLSSRIHPEDVDRVKTAFNDTRQLLGLYEIDFRILHTEEVRWVSARGQGDDAGIANRVMFGVFLNVTMRKMAEEARDLIAQEMEHRIKNLFSIAASLTQVSMRSADSKEEMAVDLSRRLTALSKAHELIIPSNKFPHKVVGLEELILILLQPYADIKSEADRVWISAPELYVGERSATTFALMAHELATNAVKYGSLSVSGGTLDVSCSAQDDKIILIWTERGGPAVIPPTKQTGFGSRLLIESVSGQLGGEIETDWQAEGIVVTMRISRALLET